ncbi:prenyltransferase/squalene oxidase repeat-containing protein [Streptomyces sp. AK02-04a]|uniref:prenyltransferase/squalene oxidase repeat-containing protein n=1 Tax=Streptomyces sp. AK02-04a TaxID=3028649 RepID=UPI0029ADC676|nr:prenyltransferase/squalene oxidase repeat-containing protein [Streptomyces sp. AK02-04a]MDX3763129.1 terpene cyclase/mutase family protein [Streptomyces sp. AK02-04a]
MSGPAPTTDATYALQTSRLLEAVNADPWGQVRPSPYETARVISLAPWLHGQDDRISWLLNQQSRYGTWGEGTHPYQLIPTLSAVEAALALLGRDHERLLHGTHNRLVTAVTRGLTALAAFPCAGRHPDTAAAEFIVPALVADVNLHLDRLDPAARPSLGPLHRGPRLHPPYGLDPAAPGRLARRLGAASALPLKVHHTFEVVAPRCGALTPVAPDGLLGSSPAATAAWVNVLSPSPERTSAVTALEAAAARYGGLFPEAVPISVFERLWTLAALAQAGLPKSFLPTARAWIHRIYDRRGVRGAPDLAPDADDTAMAVHVSVLLDEARSPDCLRAFEAGDHFACYVGEDTGSVTANAHVLRALAGYVRRHPNRAADYSRMIAKARNWLCAQQTPDGYWTDKWHASPYYATARCVIALADAGDEATRPAIESATRWAARTQRDDGSWGIWSGTAEETAYGAQILLHARPHTASLTRAETALAAYLDAPEHQSPALWHDKTLYAPEAMIRAEALAAHELLRIAREG